MLREHITNSFLPIIQIEDTSPRKPIDSIILPMTTWSIQASVGKPISPPWEILPLLCGKVYLSSVGKPTSPQWESLPLFPWKQARNLTSHGKWRVKVKPLQVPQIEGLPAQRQQSLNLESAVFKTMATAVIELSRVLHQSSKPSWIKASFGAVSQGSMAPDATVDSLPHLEGRASTVVSNWILLEAPSKILHPLVHAIHWLVSYSEHSALHDQSSPMGSSSIIEDHCNKKQTMRQRQSWRRSPLGLRERRALDVYILNTTETKANR